MTPAIQADSKIIGKGIVSPTQTGDFNQAPSFTPAVQSVDNNQFGKGVALGGAIQAGGFNQSPSFLPVQPAVKGVIQAPFTPFQPATTQAPSFLPMQPAVKGTIQTPSPFLPMQIAVGTGYAPVAKAAIMGTFNPIQPLVGKGY
jgi:hypothetical protein